MFVRFVVGTDAENAAWLTGVMATARILSNDGELYRHEAELLENVFAWFNEHLPCPPFEEKLRSGEWTRDAVSWFRADAQEPLGRIWDIVAILKEHGTPPVSHDGEARQDRVRGRVPSRRRDALLGMTRPRNRLRANP